MDVHDTIQSKKLNQKPRSDTEKGNWFIYD